MSATGGRPTGWVPPPRPAGSAAGPYPGGVGPYPAGPVEVVREPRTPGWQWGWAAAVCGAMVLLGPVLIIGGWIWYAHAYPVSEDEGTTDAWGEFAILVWGFMWMAFWVIAAVSCCVVMGLSSRSSRVHRPPADPSVPW